MSRRLSHSAVTKYQTCPRAYHYHYNERLRPTVTSGALLFGSAMDTALNELVTNKNLEKAMDAFDAAWKKGRVGNAEDVELPFNEKIVYANADYDYELLTQEDQEHFASEARNRKFNLMPADIMSAIAEGKKTYGWDKLNPIERQQYNFGNWLSLRRKGYLMLIAYYEKILPQFKTILASQRKIELINEEGDSIIGFIDLVVELNDGRVVILDNKTSSIAYDPDAVERSAQLAVYANAVRDEWNTPWAGYIIMRKGIIKNRNKVCSQCGFQAEAGARHKTCTNEDSGSRCGGEWITTISPEVDINVMIDKLPPRTEEIVMENFADISHMIKANIYPRNFNSCKQPWGDCAYMKLCWKDDAAGLEKVEESK